MIVFTPQAGIWLGDLQKSFPTAGSPGVIEDLKLDCLASLSSPGTRAHLTPTIPSVTALMSQYKGGTQSCIHINEREPRQASEPSFS